MFCDVAKLSNIACEAKFQIFDEQCLIVGQGLGIERFAINSFRSSSFEILVGFVCLRSLLVKLEKLL